MTSSRAVCLLLALLVVSGAQAGVLRVPLRKLPLTRLSSSTRPYLKQLIASANAVGAAPVPLRNFLDAQVWVWPHMGESRLCCKPKHDRGCALPPTSLNDTCCAVLWRDSAGHARSNLPCHLRHGCDLSGPSCQHSMQQPHTGHAKQHVDDILSS